MLEYAALVVSPRALPDGLILVFQHPAKTVNRWSKYEQTSNDFQEMKTPIKTTTIGYKANYMPLEFAF